MLKRRLFLKRAAVVTASALLGRRSIAQGLSASANSSSGPASHASPLHVPGAPLGLLVNGVANPLAIDRDTTRFTWRHEAHRRDERQTAYQILVASSPASLNAAKGDFWDSGKVVCDRSAAVEYSGKALPRTARFWWKVRIWNQSGKPSPYSAPAFFDTGLNPGEWTAQYIWDGTTNPNNYAYFRRSLSIVRRPVLAKVYVTAQNDCLLYFNGRLLGRGPARCNFYKYGQYNSFDITDLVHIGPNAMAAVGQWADIRRQAVINAGPAFLLEAKFDYADGTSEVVATDRSWKVLAHTSFIETDPTYFKGNRPAIRFDSRLEPAGWRTAGFDDSAWAAATVVDRSNFRLFAQVAPLERAQAELKPLSITQTDGAWMVDFGRCIDGWPKLTMHNNHSGDTVRVQYFQMTGERKAAGWDEYICHGGTEIWEPNFGRYASFQVVKITGYTGKLRPSDIRGILAFCNADVEGRFRCSSPLANAVYKMCVRSAQQNVQQGIISVDADREQAQWLADSYLVGNVLLYNDSNTTIINKVVHDFAAEQFPDGYIPAISPGHRVRDCCNSSRIPEWAMYWPMLLWQQYLFYGDTSLLSEMAPRVARLMNWLKTFQDPTTKLLNPITTWRISDYAGGNMPKGGYNVATACQYYENLRIASRMFSVLGQTGQSNAYSQEAEDVKAGINAHLFNGEYYLARTDRKEMFPLAQAWPLRFGIEPGAEISSILEAIEKAGKPDIGGYGGDAFYSGMLNAGGGAFVMRDLARYRPMLESNKACWESFRYGPNFEVNHAWTSYPGYLFLKYILGIQPTSGGFATFDIRPETSGPAFAEGAVPTVKGLITTRWEKDAQGRFTLSVAVPPNTRASIYIPKAAKQNFVILETGRRLWPPMPAMEVPGVHAVQEEELSIKCNVGSGTYQFTKTHLNS